MKYMNVTLSIFLACLGLLSAKESLATMKAFEAYEKNDTESPKIDLAPRIALSNLLKKENLFAEVEETLATLQSVRISPSEDLIPQLKELWKIYHKNTFRTKDPEKWYLIKGLDSSQRICDEIKKLIRTMGGSIDDIEPREEKNTFDLNEIRTFLGGIKDGSHKEPLTSADSQFLAKELSTIIKTCKFGASNRDEILQMFYVLSIIQMLNNEAIWPVQKKVDATDPVIAFFDDTLGKTLPLIEENWIQKPTGSLDQKEDEPSAEQMAQWHRNSLEGYQQMNLGKIRDQILINVSNLVTMRRDDQLFRQEMIKRFSKNDACLKMLNERLN